MSGKIFIYGGRGALGSAVVSHFKAQNWVKEGMIGYGMAKAAVHQLTTPTSICRSSGMIGYGMAKAAVHQLTKSLASDKSGLPENSLAVALLPVTLDTPMNRKWMPDADTSTWTPLQYVAELFWKWTNGIERPPNGSLVELETKNNQTKLNLH
ncbi:dihydropteridine reductase [Diaphorina citri]|uniref:Dihydropteridine reductase n=1 Tax=Diaphorina citri TaxID=121845 RepID=A0A3Q0IR64_DIACI|nr:dihydropteridine reductase [Diaphorina citri]